MEFKGYKLEEVCEIGSSKRIYLADYTKNGIPFYRGKEIIEMSNRKNISNKLYISNKKYEEIKSKFGVPIIGDILITAVGTLGECWLVDQKNFYFKDGNLIWIHNYNNDLVDKNYLYYLIKSKKFKEMIASISIGSTQKAITIKEIKNIKIKLPSLENQNKIVKILSNIDKKMELNNRINDSLYLVTNRIYEKIFINNRKIEWKKYNLLELADIYNGYSYTGKELANDSKVGMVTIKNFERNGGFKENGFKAINPKKVKENHYLNKFDILVACTDLTQNADIIGNAILLLNNGNYEKNIFSMDLVKVFPKLDKFLIYSILNSQEFKNHALGYKSGTTVLHLNKDCFKDFDIKLPDADLIDKFIKVAKANYEKISLLLDQNNGLEKLRGTLLPKLLNGEIDLDNIDI